jgi:hypothetical protein
LSPWSKSCKTSSHMQRMFSSTSLILTNSFALGWSAVTSISEHCRLRSFHIVFEISLSG